MKIFVMTKGLPASGKSSYATSFVLDYPAGKATRINKDLLRAMLNADRFKGAKTERLVTAARDTLIELSMERELEYIISDDTNFHPSCEETYRELCRKYGYEFRVKDFTDVDVETCIKRDLKRQVSVGERVIRSMHAKWIKGEGVNKYVPNLSKPRAIMVDIDGTVALMDGRSPYDPTLYHTDIRNGPIADLIEELHALGDTIVFCSGRDDTYHRETIDWLRENFTFPIKHLYMRTGGDKRKDWIVKQELFDANIRDSFNVRFVLDDRNQVVDMWRSIGLTVLQVADGAF